MSKFIKKFQNTPQRVGYETNNYIEPYVSLTLNDTTYSARWGGVEEYVKDVTPNADGTYTISFYYQPSITTSSTNSLVAFLYEQQEYIEVSSEGVVEGQDTTFTINGVVYDGVWFSYESSGWELFESQTTTNTENSTGTNNGLLRFKQSIGSVLRLVITEHDNGQLIHYNKTKIATLTLTDDSVLKIEGYFDDVHTLIEGMIAPYSDTLKEVVIHKTVTTIGDSAFQYCTSLKTVTFEDPTKLRYWGQWNGDYTFGDCHSLETINLTADTPITYMPYRGFMRNYKLKSIIIPDTVVKIEDMALCDCTSLTEITIPKNVTKINMQAFDGCSGLTRITCLAVTPPTLYGTDVFHDTNNCPIYVPAESVSIYKAASVWSSFSSRIQAIPTT